MTGGIAAASIRPDRFPSMECQHVERAVGTLLLFGGQEPLPFQALADASQSAADALADSGLGDAFRARDLRLGFPGPTTDDVASLRLGTVASRPPLQLAFLPGDE